MRKKEKEREKYMKYKILISAALIVALMISIAPALAFVGPPYSGPGYQPWPTEDNRFEMFGPWVNTLYISMYASAEAEWDALETGAVDFTDWPLTVARLQKYTVSPTFPHIAVADAGGEFGSYYLDLRNDVFTNDNENNVIGDEGDLRNPLGDPTLIELPLDHPYAPGAIVTRGSQFRLAIAHLVDRDAIIAMADGATPIHYPMYTHLPEETAFRFAGWINDDVPHYPYDPALAAQILTWAGYVDTDGDGWRNYDSNGDGVIDATDANINLVFYTRLDAYRTAIGDFVQNALINPPINVQVTRRPVTGGGAWNDYMLIKKGNMYTAGWILSRMPTLLYGLFHSQFYWHPGDPPNYNKVSDPVLDAVLEELYAPPTVEDAKEACHLAQYLLLKPENVYNIPMGNNHMYKAYKKWYSEGTTQGPYWLGVLNTLGYGINTGALPLASDFSMRPETGTATVVKYGWQQNWVPSSLNPYQYSWYWDAEVIFRVYEGCMVTNPFNAFGGGPMGEPGDLPWLAWAWEQQVDVEGGTTKVTFYLRDDVYFHDGIKMTAKDYYYTVQLGHWMAEDHPEYGWTALPPWFWESIADITPEYDTGDTPGVGVDMPDGPDGYRIVVNYNVASAWALWYAGGVPIVPKHKWWDVFYPDPTGVDGFAPDPQMVGTGPWKFYPHYADGSEPEYHTLGQWIKMDINPNYHHKYVAGKEYAKYIRVTFGSPDIYVDNTGPTTKTVTLLVTVWNAETNEFVLAGKIENVKVPKGSWGVSMIPGLSPGRYKALAVALPFEVIGWSEFEVPEFTTTLPGDIARSTAKYQRLPPDNRVNFMDQFWFGKTNGQTASFVTTYP
ncbi:MAG: ABC transporter substrate-binding protein [Candidatus Bathyarchaeia archaeon]